MYTDLTKFCVGSDVSIREAIARMDGVRLGIVLVVDDGQRLVGVITDGDVRRALLAKVGLDLPVSALLAQKSSSRHARPVTAPAGADRETCLHLLRQANSLHLPVVDEEQRVVGLITLDEFVPQEVLPLQAVIMAGGLGSRLRPLTDDTPKPMLPVGERPLMEIIIQRLRDAGIRRVNITTHHKPEKISDHFGDGREFGVEITYVREDRPLGTAGGISLLEPLRDTLLVINGDILTQVDFRAMLVYHQEHHADLTLAVTQYEMQVPYGVVECESSRVRKISEKPVLGFFVNAGIYLLEPSVHSFIPNGEPFDMTELIQRLLNAGRSVVSFPIREYWLDIGQPADYLHAQLETKTWKPGS